MTFEIIILGSSSALPTSRRYTAAHLFNINERFFLVDCGEGTQVRLRQLHLSPAKINHIFISHIHGDHVFGLFGLISSLGMMGRRVPLHLYGPSLLEKMIHDHLAYFGPLQFELHFHVAGNEEILYEDKQITVKAFRLKHRTDTFGYLFREKPPLLNIRIDKLPIYRPGIEAIKKIKEGEDFVMPDGRVVPNSELTLPPVIPRSYAYISDTAYLPGLAKQLEGTDLLYHEATFLEKDAALAKETMHSTARQAGMMARDSGAGKLLIGHFSTRYKHAKWFEEEAGEVFSNVVAVNDGDRFEVELRREEQASGNFGG